EAEELRIAVGLLVPDRRMDERHLRPVGVELVGQHRGERREGALPHLGRRRYDGDGAVGRDGHPGSSFERRLVRRLTIERQRQHDGDAHRRTEKITAVDAPRARHTHGCLPRVLSLLFWGAAFTPSNVASAGIRPALPSHARACSQACAGCVNLPAQASTSSFPSLREQTWMERNSGLPEWRPFEVPQVGYTRLAVTSPAMTRRECRL